MSDPVLQATKTLPAPDSGRIRARFAALRQAGRGGLVTFLNDASANAYEKMVERYLASPRFGERWGKHWLWRNVWRKAVLRWLFSTRAQ